MSKLLTTERKIEMSRWGYVSASGAIDKFTGDPKEAGRMVEEMAKLVIDQDKEISDLKSKVIELQTGLMLARGGEAHLRGYVERVKELDAPAAQPKFKIVPDTVT